MVKDILGEWEVKEDLPGRGAMHLRGNSDREGMRQPSVTWK
jgi:hypothetical protein